MALTAQQLAAFQQAASGANTSKKKKDEGFSFGDFIHDAGEAVFGLPAGLFALGKSGVHDAGKLIGVSDGPFQLDDVGRAIGQGWAAKYGPALPGGDESWNFGKSWGRMKSDSFGTMLDLLSVASLGAGGVGKAGLAASKAGQGATAVRGAKLAGFTPVTGRALGLEKLVQMGGHTAADGAQFIPRISKIKTSGGKRVALDHSTNPLIRARRGAIGKIGEAKPGLPIIGVDTKQATKLQQGARTRLDRAKYQNLLRLDEIERTLSKKERRAAWAVLGDHNPDELLSYYKSVDDAPDDAAQFIKRRVKMLEDADVYKLVREPSTNLKRFRDEARKVSEETTKLMQREGVKVNPDRPYIEHMIIKGRELTPEEKAALNPVVRSHVVDRGVSGKAFNAAKGRPVPGATKKNEGKAFAAGLDADDPRAVVRSYMDVASWVESKQRYNELLDNAKRFDSPLDVPKGWRTLDNRPALKKYAANIKDFLDNEAGEIFDNPELKELSAKLEAAVAKRAGDQGVHAVPDKIYRSLFAELRKDDKVLKNLVDRPNDVFRFFTLSTRPAWWANGMVSNALLLYASHNPIAATKALLESLSTRKKSLVDQNVPEVLTAGFHRLEADDLLRREHSANSKVDAALKPFRAVSRKSGQINSTIADDPFRRAAGLAFIRKETRKAQKEFAKNGHKITRQEAASVLLKDEAFRGRVADHVFRSMINFGQLSALESEWARRLIAFYPWLKGAVKRSGRLVLDEPTTALILAEIGEAGNEFLREEVGELPSYARGIPVGGEGDEANIVTTASWNPFVTAIDVMEMGRGLVTGNARAGASHPFANISPVFKAFYEAGSGKEVFSGRTVDEDESPLETLFKRYYGSLATPNAVQDFINPDRVPSKLYDRTRGTVGGAFFGLPWKNVDLSVAATRAKQEEKQLRG